MDLKSDVQLDAKGLACPMPIVRTKKAMAKLEDGQILEVQATDKGSTADMSAWAKTVGHQYLGTKDEGGVLYHFLRKCSDDSVGEQAYEPTISSADIVERAQAQNGLILDVREDTEYAFGHIPGAKSLPMGDLDTRMGELDKNQEIYVICRSGRRSNMACQKLASLGFTQVYNALPGMGDYQGKVEK